jgi:hypothetical protein
MKHLLTVTALLISSLAMGQWPSLPYNPDENGDGLIGVVDLQGLLSSYGSEFSSAVVSEDGESAIVYMGEMDYFSCDYSCAQLPGMWLLSSARDLVAVYDVLNASEASTYTWVRRDDYVGQIATQNYFPIYRGRSISADRDILGDEPNFERRCYCAAKQLPRVEYFTCKASCSDGPAALDACVNDKLIEGWYPLQSQRQQAVYNDCFWQPLWRWAE